MKIIKSLAIVTLSLVVVSCSQQRKKATSLDNEIDSISYAIGVNMSQQFKTNLKEVDKDKFIQGLEDGLDSINLLMQEDTMPYINAYFQKKREKEQAEELAKAEVYKQEGIAFLEENKTKPGVKTTESGLQYIVLKEGKGPKPSATSEVKLHYHGTLLDGTVFDSSVDKNTPIEMTVNRFVKGFSEGLQLMSEGAKYKFFIPQELGYGSSPRSGGAIKPYMTIIFEVEMIEIKK